MLRLITLLVYCFFSFTAAASNEKQHHYSTVQSTSFLTASSFTIYHAAYLPVDDSTNYVHLKRKAKWVKWLGIGSLASLIIPIVNILSIPAAIVSLVMGSHIKKQTTNKEILKDVSIGKGFSIGTLVTVAAIVLITLLTVLLLIEFFRLLGF